MFDPKRIVLWTFIITISLGSLLIVFLPVWMIQPFQAQTPRILDFSYALKRWSWLTGIGALILFLVILLVIRPDLSRWWKKTTIATCLVILLISAWFSRQNHFEWMFQPLHNPRYVSAKEVGFLAANDMVLSVQVAGDSVAYPVRFLAYHHLVQDVVGGHPIVATY